MPRIASDVISALRDIAELPAPEALAAYLAVLGFIGGQRKQPRFRPVTNTKVSAVNP